VKINTEDIFFDDDGLSIPNDFSIEISLPTQIDQEDLEQGAVQIVESTETAMAGLMLSNLAMTFFF
jgi:hypothetical protein